MLFRCGRFPKGEALIRTHLGIVVPFRDGEAEVEDPELAQALLDAPAIYGITVVGGEDGSAGDSLSGERVQAPPGPDELPDGLSVPATQVWVAGDPVRAAAALAVETAEGGKNRSTLIVRLQEVLDASASPGTSVDS